MIEENVVAVAVAVEVVEKVMGANLQVIGHAVDLAEIGELDVHFNETDQRFVGDGELDASVRTENDAFEAGRRNVGNVVDVAQADDLHVGMANGAARVGAVILKEQNRCKFAAGDHIEPFLGTEADNPVEVVFRIERQFGCTVLGFDEDSLEGVLQHRVFVGDEQNRPVFGDNAGQLVAIAKRAFMANIYNGHRFGAANLAVKNEMGMPCGHE